VVERYVVIMAGGSGTRFWPKSRKRFPKQFLEIGGSESLIAQTASRVAQVVGWDKLLVVTGREHSEHALTELPELLEHNLLVEPSARNTAPCIGWAADVIRRRSPAAKVAVLPADHFIGDVAGFLATLDAAFSAAEGRIVLFGIVPDHPETGYGYIEKGDAVGAVKDRLVHHVASFVEKPDREAAERFFESGRFLWNSGMFVFPAQVMLEEIELHLPELEFGLAELRKAPGDIDRIYPALPSISIDYAVMEKSERIAVMPASFAWSDVGSWDAATEVYAPDDLDNVILGDALTHEVQRSFIDAASGRLVAVVGLADVIVVDTPDAVLVCRRGHSQDVKKIVQALEAQARKDLL
jgi:mannose-1-phosphate guanylyltransferase